MMLVFVFALHSTVNAQVKTPQASTSKRLLKP